MNRLVAVPVMVIGLLGACAPLASASEGQGNYPPTTAVQRTATTTVTTTVPDSGLPKTGSNSNDDLDVALVGLAIGTGLVVLCARERRR